MKIVSYILLAAAVLFIGYANAASSFTFGAATDGSYSCPSYCVGFTTTDPAHTVNSVNVQVGNLVFVNGAWVQSYNYIVSVDGVEYRANNITNQPFLATGGGQSGMFTAHFTKIKGCTVNHPCYHYHTSDGSVNLP